MPVDAVLILAAKAAAAHGISSGDRALSTTAWDSAEALLAIPIAVLGAGASLVQVSNADPAKDKRRRVVERVTVTADPLARPAR
jgi:hypothetical protein